LENVLGRLVESCPSQEPYEDCLHRLFSLLTLLRGRPASSPPLAYSLLRKYIDCLLRVEKLR
jgi:hypothetical protein